MKVLFQQFFYTLAICSIPLSAISGFQTEALAVGQWYATHPSSSVTWQGDTEKEVLKKCETWAKTAKKDPDKCEANFYGI